MEASPPAVLVVEDERPLAALYRDWLADDYAVEVANTGEAALRALDDALDVVLLDRRIPDRSGDDVLAEIRDRGLDCRVAMVTAVAPAFDVLELGFDDYLVKPVDRAGLRATVERLLRRSAYAADVQRYFALASKKAVLDAELPAAERRDHDRYRELESSLAEAYDELQDRLAALDGRDYEALFRDLAEPPLQSG